MAKYAKPTSSKRSAGPSIAKLPGGGTSARLGQFLSGSTARGSSANDGPRPKVAKLPGGGTSAKLGQFLSEGGASLRPSTAGKSTGSGLPQNRRGGK